MGTSGSTEMHKNGRFCIVLFLVLVNFLSLHRENEKEIENDETRPARAKRFSWGVSFSGCDSVR
jgi:hypothetical protein